MHHPLLTQLAQSFNSETWHDLTVIVAVSGGADSVALLRALTATRQAGRGRLVAAHFNHGLRGREAAQDEAFTADLCRRLSLDFELGRAAGDLRQAKTPDGIEAAARKARYHFLTELARSRGARYVATAHTADDQAETILHRILRGTGLAGLAGIPRTRELTPGITLVRPLLEVRRRDVLDYLQSLGQAYRDDSSNLTAAFTRNRLRHELLPLVASQYNPQIYEALLRLGRLAGESQQLVEQLGEPLLAHCQVADAGDRAEIRAAPLRDVAPLLLRTMLIALWKQLGWPQQEMGYDRWDQLAALVQADTRADRCVFPGGVAACRQDDLVTLQRAPAGDPAGGT